MSKAAIVFYLTYQLAINGILFARLSSIGGTDEPIFLIFASALPIIGLFYLLYND